MLVKTLKMPFNVMSLTMKATILVTFSINFPQIFINVVQTSVNDSVSKNNTFSWICREVQISARSSFLNTTVVKHYGITSLNSTTSIKVVIS